MEKALKMRLKVSREAAECLEGQMRICNSLYNHLVEESLRLRTEFQKSQDKEVGRTLYTERGLRNLIPGIKREKPYLKLVHSSPLKNVGLRVSKGIRDYQDSRKGKRKGRKTGWPKFKSHKVKPFSLLYDEPKKGFKLQGRTLRLSLGETKDRKRCYLDLELEKPLSHFGEVELRQLRIKKELDCFYAIFSVRTKDTVRKPVARVIALDPNHKNLATGIDQDGNICELQNPYFRRSLQKSIDSVKSKRDKALRKSVRKESPSGKVYWLPSRRWQKRNQTLQRLHRKRREQNKTYLYSLSHWLCAHYDLIAVGDYTPRGGGINRGMRRSMNNESLIGRFKETLSWVATRSGKEVMIWPERNSTKTCADCGHSLEKSLSPAIREWHCPECHTHHDRDVNAARNGLHHVLRTEDINIKVPCSGHSLNEFEGCAVRWTGLGLEFHSRPGARPSSLEQAC